MELTVFPDGRGLPDGSGTPEEGKVLYAAHCVACHGPEGQGGSGGELVGKSPLNGPHPDQTIGNYWPYATTLFDFIRRSMPLNAPRSLTDPNIYALTAYLLHLNGIISKDHAVNAKTLPEIKMPNREGFTRIWPHSN
jgi:cytochrome c